MSTYRYVLKDISQTFQQLNPSSKIKEAHLLFWIQTIANRIRKQHIEKGYETGRYLNVFTAIPVLKQAASVNPNVVKGRKYFVLPRSVYDFNNEKGINYISYEFADDRIGWTKVFFQPTSPSRAHRLFYSPYEKPSSTNPYFYRVHDNIYLLGVESVTVKTVEAGLYSDLNPRTNLVDLDDDIDLTEEQISTLRYEVLNLGRFALNIPQDRTNDGEDTATLQGRTPSLNVSKATQREEE